MSVITFLKNTHPDNYHNFVQLALMNFTFSDDQANKLLKLPLHEEIVEHYRLASNYIKGLIENKKDPKSVVGGLIALVGDLYGRLILNDSVVEYSRDLIAGRKPGDETLMGVAKSIDKYMLDNLNEYFTANNITLKIADNKPERELTQKDIDEFEENYIKRLNKT